VLYPRCKDKRDKIKIFFTKEVNLHGQGSLFISLCNVQGVNKTLSAATIYALTESTVHKNAEINHLKTKRVLFYIRTQRVPRSKDVPFQLQKPVC
jgi:hypothetical protein